MRTVDDIQTTLAAKGFQIQPLRIYEVDGPADPTAPRVEGKEGADPRLARLMPCRVNVFAEGDRAAVTTLRSTLLCEVFPKERIEDLAAALERVLVAVVDEACS